VNRLDLLGLWRVTPERARPRTPDTPPLGVFASVSIVSVTPESDSEEFIREWDEGDLSEYVVAATVEAEKPPR